MSKQLILFGKVFEISDQAVLYNVYYKQFSELAATYTGKFRDYYFNEINNIDMAIGKSEQYGQALLDESLRLVIKRLIEKGIYEVDTTEFLEISDEKPDAFYSAMAALRSEADKIDAAYRQAEAQRNAAVNSASSSWSGGGFGVTGAIKGAATAAALNAASGMVAKAVTSGSQKSALSAREQNKLNLFNDPKTLDSLLNGLYDDIFSYLKGFVKILHVNRTEEVDNIPAEDIRRSNSIFNNLTQCLYDDEELQKKMWIKMLTYYPYNVKYYTLLLRQHDECFDEIIELAKWYGIPMNIAAAEVISAKYTFDGIENLEEAESRKQLLLADMRKYNMDDSPLLLAADNCIEQIRNKNRTYLGVLYNSDEEKAQAETMDRTFKEWISNTNPSDLNATVNLYLYILNNEPEKNYPSIRQSNSAVVGGMIVNDVQNNPNHTIDELNYYLNIFANDPNVNLNQGIMQVMQKQIKKLNRSQNGFGGIFGKKQ